MSYPTWEEIRKGHRIAGREIPMLLPDMPSFTFMSEKPASKWRTASSPSRLASPCPLIR